MVADAPLTEFRLEYAISGKAGCVICDKKIPKSAVRVSKKDPLSERAVLYGSSVKFYSIRLFCSVAH